MSRIGLSGKILLMGITCLILAFFVWKWTDNRINFYLSQINSGLERIAQVKTKSNDVTRNHSGQLLWQGIDSGEIVYIGNSVQTEKNSSTEIIFDDGEQIMIGPESLVRFVRADNKISLQLVSGRIEINSADADVQQQMRLPAAKPKRLFVATPKGRLELNNSRLKLQAKDDNSPQNFKVEVLSGEPELVTESEREVLKVSSEPKIEVLPVAEKPVVVDTPKTLEATPETLPAKPVEPVVEPTRAPTEEPIEKIADKPEKPPVPLKAPKVRSIKVEANE